MGKKIVCIFSILLVVVYLMSCEKAIPSSKKGDADIHRFEIGINTAFEGEPANIESDEAVLIMPKTKKPARLVIYCHSGGNITNDSGSEAERSDIVHYLVYKGYAVLDVCGMPETYANRIKVDYGRTVGSHVSLRAAVAGYNHVIENFNIAKDGCFVFSNSNGGLLASNIVNLTEIPVLAQSGVAPLLSIEQNTWYVDSEMVFPTDFGFKKYQNRANVIRIFGMKDINNQEDLNRAVYEKNKVGKYDPFDYCMNQSRSAYRVPYLIFTLKKDMVIYYNIAETFMKEMNSRGSNIIISDITEYGGHSIPPTPIIVGNYTYIGDTEDLKLTERTIGDFFDTYNPKTR